MLSSLPSNFLHFRYPRHLVYQLLSSPSNFHLLCVCVCVCVCVCLATQLCPTLCDPMDCSLPGCSLWGFSRQEYWSLLPWPPPVDLPNPGIKLGSPALQTDFTSWATKEALPLLYLNKIQYEFYCSYVVFSSLFWRSIILNYHLTISLRTICSEWGSLCPLRLWDL